MGKGVPNYESHLALDLAAATGTWGQDEKVDMPLLLGRKPFTWVLRGEGALCSWLQLSAVASAPGESWGGARGSSLGLNTRLTFLTRFL